MGNICRSPTAEGVFNKLAQDQYAEFCDDLETDSAGTHAYHIGEAPDLRAQQAARERGVELTHLRARKVIMGDFEDFDLLLAMDSENFSVLSSACPQQYRHKVKYFLDYAPLLNLRDVPDPYFGGKYGFEKVLDLVEAASEGLLHSLFDKEKLK